ncbi:MAG: enoyl-CoA hydratase/isomerase family protein [Acidobacteriota bacterium]
MSNSVLVEQLDGTVTVRFNRPEIRNPLSIEVLSRLSEIVDEIEAQKDVNRLTFTGVGNVFASGADLREISELRETHAREFAERGQKLMQSISDLRVQTLAAINGVCFGGGLDLALACDRRVATRDSLFSHPGVNLGIITGWGGTQRLPRLIGKARALEMFFTTRRVTADEALQIGLIDEIADEPVYEALDPQLDLH